MDVSDTVEITGSCHDLGRKNNRILVQVFAGDLDETVDPYIDNSTSKKCLTASSGIAVGQSCFAVTKGIGLTEDAGLPDQKDFPQCHNGQFGFSVRVGKILTDAALGLNYIVRFKLRTQEGSLSDTTWSRVTITRGLTPPQINSITVDPANFNCALKNSVARFNQNLTYVLNRTYSLVAGGASAAAPVAGFGTNSASPLAYDYTDVGLVDGITYTYSIVATEGQYSAIYPAPQTITSNALTCTIPPPQAYLPQAPTANTCYLSVARLNLNPGISYDIAIGQAPWVINGVGSALGLATACSAGGVNVAPYTCSINGLVSGQTYYLSVRARGAGGEIGLWAPEVPCKVP